MVGQAMNGAYGQEPQPVEISHPMVTITPPIIRFTAAQVWAGILALPATIGMLVSLGIFYVPAKEAELQALISVVQTVQKAQEDSNAAIKRLTEAVDNLSGLVGKIPKPKKLGGTAKPR